MQAQQSVAGNRVAIGKQEFYEGAALALLLRGGGELTVRYEPPFFVLNGRFLAHLKYSTKVRIPWGFTFVPDEQLLLREKSQTQRLVIGLVCGSDGIAALASDDYFGIARARASSVHIACYRQHGEHYAVGGPDGQLARKVPPLAWKRILNTT